MIEGMVEEKDKVMKKIKLDWFVCCLTLVLILYAYEILFLFFWNDVHFNSNESVRSISMYSYLNQLYIFISFLMSLYF